MLGRSRSSALPEQFAAPAALAPLFGGGKAGALQQHDRVEIISMSGRMLISGLREAWIIGSRLVAQHRFRSCQLGCIGMPQIERLVAGVGQLRLMASTAGSIARGPGTACS